MTTIVTLEEEILETMIKEEEEVVQEVLEHPVDQEVIKVIIEGVEVVVEDLDSTEMTIEAEVFQIIEEVGIEEVLIIIETIGEIVEGVILIKIGMIQMIEIEVILTTQVDKEEIQEVVMETETIGVEEVEEILEEQAAVLMKKAHGDKIIAIVKIMQEMKTQL